ncbi:MAG: mycothiol synthase [Actinomycetales bacterium]
MSPTPLLDWPVEQIAGAPEPPLAAQITLLAAAAAEEDGNPPLSEQTLIDLRSPATTADSLLTLAAYATADGTASGARTDLAGVAVVVLRGGDGVLELAVHPSYRNQGVGELLVRTLAAARGLDGLKAWSHGNHEAAEELAAQFGFVPVRELWRMRLGGRPAAAPAAGPPLPAGVTLRTFLPGTDEEAWLRANAAAFAHHPEQGAMTRADLQARMDEQWFDPAGFFLASRDADPREILGFHWTKVHPARGGHPAAGEVYVVGVTPAAQGTGLGKALTVAGIRHLQNAGLKAIMLYVDADNAAAVALYEGLGFTRWDADVMYAPARTQRPGKNL